MYMCVNHALQRVVGQTDMNGLEYESLDRSGEGVAAAAKALSVMLPKHCPPSEN